MKQIVITVDAIGNTKVDAQNFQGVGCTDATKVFEDAFAGRTKSSELKPEYYESEAVGEKQNSSW